MQQSRVLPKSPIPHKKHNTSSSINLQSTMSKSKIILPSRYTQEKKFQKSGFHDILNQIQSAAKNDASEPEFSPKKSKALKTLESVTNEDLTNKSKKRQFKSKPLKRQESDQQNFNQIFLNPRQQALNKLKEISKTQDVKTINKEYDKLLKFQSGVKVKEQIKQVQNDEDLKNSYQECIDILESSDMFGLQIQSNTANFYEDPISMDPPDYPNSQAASLAMNSNYPSSIPANTKSIKQSNIKELLMRAKAGTNTDDIQKQAHLAYYLGQVYSISEKRNYSQALKFFRRFLGFAKAMQDKIGMCLGANRVAISYFHCGEINKSILFHNENLKLSDSDNCFVGFYNLGICHRKINKLQEAIEYFESALNWAQQKGQQQSQCISYGQLGMTYQKMQLYQESVQNYQKSLEVCNKMKKIQLKFHNLRSILRVSSQLNLKPIPALQKIAQQAYNCTFMLTPQSVGSVVNIQDIMRCNIGILKGLDQFHNNQQSLQQQDQCTVLEEYQQL